ncbi:MAG: hypothetical protein ABI599_10785 [Flavobacteriales bacterium]
MNPDQNRRWIVHPWLANGLFFAMLLLYCAVVAEGRFFPTVDGPVHSYNARLFGDLLVGDPHSSAFFHFNGVPVPYWTSTVLMWLFGILFGPTEAERAMVLLIIIATALAFRRFMHTVTEPNSIGSLLIFPFLWTAPLQLGFFNFCLGLALFFFFLSWWLRRSKGQSMVGNANVGTLLFILLFFTHLMVFAMTLAVVAGHACWMKWRMRDTSFLRSLFKDLALMALPALVLCVWYFITSDSESTEAIAIPISERWEWLMHAQPLLTLVWDQERPMARAVQAGLLLLTLAAFRHRRKALLFSPTGGAWGSLALLLFAACLLLPDRFASGTALLVRLQLFALIMWAVWCAAQPMNEVLRVLGVSLVSFGGLWHLHFQQDHLRVLRAEAEDLYSMHVAIAADATVLPLNYSANWVQGNFSDYLGLWKNTIVLDNFVARAPHAPIRWLRELEPFDDMGTLYNSLQPCVQLDAWTERTGRTIDHIITSGMPGSPTDSCTIDVQRQLLYRYDLSVVSPSSVVKLYTLKPTPGP